MPQFEFVPLDFSLSASLVCAIPSLLFDLSWGYFPFSDACYPSSYHSLSISLPILGFMVWFNVLHCLHSKGYWLLYLHWLNFTVCLHWLDCGLFEIRCFTASFLFCVCGVGFVYSNPKQIENIIFFGQLSRSYSRN